MFNLLDDPWIPCIDLTQSQSRVQLGLVDALLEAHHLKEVAHPSPIVTLAVHRLLLAFSYAALAGPRSLKEWRTTFERGHFDRQAIQTYAGSQRDRFDLFHPAQPFMQDPSLAEEGSSDEEGLTPITKLAREFASTNNVTLFDHTVDSHQEGFLPSDAACYLLADQFYALEDGRGYKPCPLAFGVSVLPGGKFLFQTLMFNLLPYNEERPIKSDLSQDIPWWESSTDDLAPIPAGWLDYLSRPYRRLLLKPIESEQGVVVLEVVRKSATGLDKEWLQSHFDPMLSYNVSADAGYSAVRLRADKALWRDSMSLLALVRRRNQIEPGYVNLLARSGLSMLTLHAFGTCGSKSRVDLWRHERLPLPRAYLEGAVVEDLHAALEQGVKLAENVAVGLKASTKRAAKEALPPGSDQPRGRPGSDAVSQLYNALGPERRYWAALDVPFRRFMVDLAETFESEGGEGARAEWAKAVRAAAREAFDGVAQALQGSGRGLRAVASVEDDFRGKLRRLVADFLPEETPNNSNEEEVRP